MCNRLEMCSCAASSIGRAFHWLAVSRWLVPDQAEGGRLLPATLRIFVDHALAHALVHAQCGGPVGGGGMVPARRRPDPGTGRLPAAAGGRPRTGHAPVPGSGRAVRPLPPRCPHHHLRSWLSTNATGSAPPCWHTTTPGSTPVASRPTWNSAARRAGICTCGTATGRSGNVPTCRTALRSGRWRSPSTDRVHRHR